MPETVSGLRYMQILGEQRAAERGERALMTVTRSFSRMTSMPIAAAASSSSEIASSASRPMPRSTICQTTSPPIQTTSAMQ